MSVYHHALVLINSSLDGVPLLAHAAKMAEENAMRITIAHISTDYRSLNYVSDSLLDDDVSREVIQAKALLNELATTVALPVQTLSLVTTRRFADVEACVRQRNIDLIIAGHHNRLLAFPASHSLEYINHLTVDVLIKHLPDSLSRRRRAAFVGSPAPVSAANLAIMRNIPQSAAAKAAARASAPRFASARAAEAAPPLTPDPEGG